MFYKCLNKTLEVLTVIILVLITAMVSAEVILRYGFGGSLLITEEFTRYALIWMVFLACSLAVAENSHIRVEFAVNLFKGKAKAWVNLIAQMLFTVFLVFLIVQGAIALPFQLDQIIPTLDISMFWFYMALPVGGALMIVNLLPQIWANVLIVIGKVAPPPDEAPTLEGGLGL
ncbi:MAG: TRAP transporter small permease [Deltaproteobacteria bacterium]|nr:TRAP transporter small permease [Deltaproteobacteria bacterium]